ncbi:MAG: sensor histidine kinase [Lachnobacterium sp.]|nr:sensor histidine kinase [Lachnobacterium sp.]
MKKRFLSLGLREKIQFLFLCTMIVCILFCSGIFYLILENQMQQSIADKEISNRTAISNNLDSTMKSINSISRLTMLRSTVRTFLLAESNSTPRTRNALQEIHDILNTFNLSCNVVILRMDGQYLNTGPGITYVNTDKIFETEWLDEVMAQKGNYVIKAGTRDAFRSNIGEMVSFVRVINDINTQKPIGILAINLPSRFFEQVYEGLSGETSHFALYDTSGRLICKDNESTFSSLNPENLLQNTREETDKLFYKSIFTCDTLGDSHFILASRLEVRILDGLPAKLLVALIIGAFILLAFMWLINTYIAKNVIYPIQRLVDSMAEVQNGWLHRVSMNVNDDEIGLLKNSYNAMLIEINQLIEELLQKEKTLRMAELDALQEQMKPHFLYNTLDMIRYMALENRTDEVYNMLETLGNFYRRFLSKGSTDLSLEEEIEIVKSYLTLQRTRFEDIFTDEYEIEEGLSSIRVPRLILQPLVENSIYHGIRPKGEHGVIRVTVKRQEDFLFLSIYDNGIGMSAHQRELLFSGKDSRSFGFQGTIERIRYYYKTEDVFEIHSTEGEYCEIILKLPLSNGC